VPRPMNDLVVVVPGILGTELRKEGRLLWGFPEGLGGLVRAKADLRRAVAELTLRGDDPRAEDIGDGVQAVALVSVPQIVAGLIKTDGYDLLRERLFDAFQLHPAEANDCPPNYLEFPYDWRRDLRASAHRLHRVVAERLARLREDSGNPAAKVIFICHSMGGLVARYHLEVLCGWESCRALITLGTPHRGAVDALNFLTQGFKKLGVDMTAVLRSCTSVYQLLPVYEMVDVGGRFHRVAELADVPNVPQQVAMDARGFHEEIREAVEARHERGYLVFPVAGTDQPTLQSAELVAGVLTASEHVPDKWPTYRETGDRTVPYVSAIPLEMSDNPQGSFTVPTCHAMLQSSEDVWKYVRMILDRLQDQSLGGIFKPPSEGRAAEPAIQLRMSDVYVDADPVTFRARILRPIPALKGLEAELRPARGGTIGPVPMTPAGEEWELTIPDLSDGVYRLKVKTMYEGPGAPVSVEDVFEVARQVGERSEE
jgi:hypothetical protein